MNKPYEAEDDVENPSSPKDPTHRCEGTWPTTRPARPTCSPDSPKIPTIQYASVQPTTPTAHPNSPKTL